MEQKIRIAIIGLVVLIMVCIIAIFQVYSSKQTLERQIDSLSNENRTLQQQADQFNNEKRSLDQKMISLKENFDKVALEKDDLLRKYDLVNRAKEDLLEQIKTLKNRVPSQQPQIQQQVFTAPAGEDAYWGALIKQKTDLELQLSSVREELRKMQLSNEQVLREKSALELDMTGLNRDKQDLKRQIEYNQKIMDSVTSELVREKNDKLQIENTLKTIKNENYVLRRQIKALSNRKVELEKKISELQFVNEGLISKTDQVDTLLKDKLAQIDNIKNQITYAQRPESIDRSDSREVNKGPVTLSPIVIRPPDTSAKVDGSQRIGKVSAINKDNNFVIVNMGEDSGLKVGDIFQVYRDNKAIANLEVIQVRKAIAACDIKKEAVAIRVGDIVR